MFIKSITIKNFRCFGKGIDNKGTKIELNDGVTAFIGKNGSGKTTVLEALNYLIGQDYLPTKISEKDFHCEANDIKDEIFIEGETVSPFFLNVDVIDNNRSPITVVVPCNKIKLTIKRREKASQVLNDSYIPEKTVVPIIGKIDNELYQDEKFKKLYYPIISLEEVDSDIPDLESAKEIIKNLLKGQSIETKYFEKYYQVKYKLKSHQGEIKNVDFPEYSLKFNVNKIKGFVKSYYLTKNRDNDVSGNYSFISKILTDLHWKYKREESKNKKNEEKIKEKIKNKEIPILKQYNKLSESLRNIIDKKGDLIKEINEKVKSICSDDKNFQIDFIDIDQPYKSAFVAKKESGKLLLPDNLGSGFNILIAYALFAYVAEQEKIPIVLIIDEPELHLHSDWQKKMYDVFTKQTNLQFVYSTQSENFISLKNWRQIRSISDFQIFPKEEVLQKQITAIDRQNGTRADYLDDYAKKNLHISTILRENLELFFTKKCILVEGPSDKYGLTKFLEFSGCNIENFSVSIIPAWGKTKIKNYQMICKCFEIDFYTIFDQDKKEDGELEIENDAIENNAQTEKIFKFSTNFEQKLGISINNKFQKMVKLIDKLDNIDLLDQEIKDCINKLKGFIESN